MPNKLTYNEIDGDDIFSELELVFLILINKIKLRQFSATGLAKPNCANQNKILFLKTVSLFQSLFFQALSFSGLLIIG